MIPEFNDPNIRAVVVDNASMDGSCEEITSWINNNLLLKQVKLIASDKNTGFSGGGII